jgi:hypothetical protein
MATPTVRRRRPFMVTALASPLDRLLLLLHARTSAFTITALHRPCADPAPPRGAAAVRSLSRTVAHAPPNARPQSVRAAASLLYALPLLDTSMSLAQRQQLCFHAMAASATERKPLFDRRLYKQRPRSSLRPPPPLPPSLPHTERVTMKSSASPGSSTPWP